MKLSATLLIAALSDRASGHDDHHNHVRGLTEGKKMNGNGHGISAFHALGKDWKDKQEFVESGAACGYREPSEDEERKARNRTNVHRRKKEALIALGRLPDEKWNKKNGNKKESKKGLRRLQLTDEDIYTVNVYFHNIHKTDGTGYISDATIEKQINVLNEGFSGEETSYGRCNDASGINSVPGGYVTPIRFVLAETIRTANDSWFNNIDNDGAYKPTLHRGTCSDLNIYTGNSNYLGFAYFPSGVCSATNPSYVDKNDGVVLAWNSLPDLGAGGGSYDDGDTATHEVGHWLGLHHTFYGGCNGAGDEVSDTAPERSDAFGCPMGRDTCSGGSADPIHNFMDYTDDCCMFKFSGGQTTRMVDMIETYRHLSPGNGGPPSPTTTATPPTPAPPCTNTNLDFTFNTDNYGAESTWKITSGGETIAGGGPYPNNLQQAYVTPICLEDGDYVLVVDDSYGDGICCEYGSGSYALTHSNSGEDLFSSSGNFGSSETTAFSIPFVIPSPTPAPMNNPTPAPVNPTSSPVNPTPAPVSSPPGNCPSGQVEFKLKLRADDYPEEVKWHLKERVDGSWVTHVVKGFGSYCWGSDNGCTWPNFEEKLCIDDNSNKFRFQITDQAYDGICCEYGNGNYEISVNGVSLHTGGTFARWERTVWRGTEVENQTNGRNGTPLTESSEPVNPQIAEIVKGLKENNQPVPCLVGGEGDACSDDDDCCSGMCMGRGKCATPK